MPYLRITQLMASRTDKLSRQIQKDMGPIIDRFVAARLPGSLVTITDTVVTPDLGLAKLYLSIMSKEPADKVVELLELEMKELRHRLAAEIGNNMRRVPELKFFLDNTLEKALKMNELLEQLNHPDKKDNKRG